MEIFGDTMMFGSIRSASDELDLSELEVLTGHEAILATQRILDRQKELIEERRARESARLSEPRSATTSDGVTWEYVMVDDAFARITGCALPSEAPTLLTVPDELDALPVLELGAGALASLASVEEIVCADRIQSIGLSAFRLCRDLKRLVLPRSCAEFDASWVNQCRKLEELVLPGMLPHLDSAPFQIESLRRLRIGFGCSGVEPGACATSKLHAVEIDEANPFLATDCIGIYERIDAGENGRDNRLRLAAIAVANDEYNLLPNCVEVGPKAFAGCARLRRIRCSGELERIGAHAFARTQLESFESPASLRSIERRAFYRCEQLSNVELAPGLESIGEEAFAETALRELSVPASVTSLARDCVRKTAVACSGSHATLRIEDGSALTLDDNGVLYAADSGNPYARLVGMMDERLERYHVHEGCLAIGARAFASAERLRSVVLPEGLERIEEGAFKQCMQLRSVDVPESLRWVGDEAFYGTALESLVIPAALEHIGAQALVMGAELALYGLRTLDHLKVSPDNARFYLTEGLLCERYAPGRSRVLLYDESRSNVRIPPEVDTLCAYAFGNARNLRELFLSTCLEHLETRALNVNCLIERIHVDFEEPIEGYDSIDLRFPHTNRSLNEIARGFNSMTHLNVELLLARYDSCVVNMHDFDAKSVGPVDLYGQVTRIIERLEEPLFLSETTRRMYDQILRENLVEMCVAAARHDDRVCIDALAELGYLDRETILPVLEAVTALQDAAMTGHLLELRRALSATAPRDFDL